MTILLLDKSGQGLLRCAE